MLFFIQKERKGFDLTVKKQKEAEQIQKGINKGLKAQEKAKERQKNQ